MKKYIHICMVAIIFFLLNGELVAQDVLAVTVCGEPITDNGWSVFSEGAGKRHIDRGDVDGLYEELRKKLTEESGGWPEHLFPTLIKAMDGLISGTLKLSDFKIVKDPRSLPAKQYAFIHTPFQIEFPNSEDNVSCQGDNEKSAFVEAAKFVMLVERSSLEIYKPYFRKKC